MLTNVFEWLDAHAWSYWAVTGGATVLLLGWIGRAMRRGFEMDCHEGFRAGPRARTKGSGAPGGATWGDAGVLGLFLLAWRWPYLLSATPYNPDESQFVAGAITLWHDPVFWRSVDGVTSGPLNLYVLLPLHALGLPIDYFTARLVGLACVWAALVACQRLLAGTSGRAAAWLGVVPATLFFATVSSAEFVHYSSEHVGLLLTALAAALLVMRPPGDRRRRWWAVFLAGAAPWAKIQVAPLTVALVGWGAWLAWRESPREQRGRCLAGVAFAAVLPTLLTLALAAAAGQAGAALQRYILGALRYTGLHASMGEALRQIATLSTADGCLPILLATTLVLLVMAGAWVRVRRVRSLAPATFGALLFAAALVAVITPRRGSLHYTLLLPVPLTILVGGLIGGAWRGCVSRRGRILLATAVLATAGLPPLVMRWRQGPPEMYGHFTDDWNHPRGRVAMLVDALAQGRGSLAIWGWACEYYVEANLPQATRDPHTFWLIEPGPDRGYHRADYLEDFERHRPPVFVDATGPAAFAFTNREATSHETFPALAALIRRDYTLVRDLGEARVYARNDLPAWHKLTPGRIDRVLSRGRLKSIGGGIAPDHQSGPLQRRNIGGGSVLMIEPPGWVDWDLPDDVREVTLQFGFDPEAYLHGHTNGAELFLELSRAGRTRTVWRRALDPANDAAARGPQLATVTLPPFRPGTRLVLRSGAGRNGDAAWDWVYLGTMNFQRRLGLRPAQLPGFAPMPTEVDAEDATLGEAGGRGALLVHRAAAFTYVLDGRERSFRFAGGLVAGDEAGGSDASAIFRAELHRPGAPRTVLGAWTITPATPGPREIEFALPVVHAGDRILLSVDLGPASPDSAAASLADVVLR